jgi:hypothetical protein
LVPIGKYFPIVQCITISTLVCVSSLLFSEAGSYSWSWY